MPQTAPFTGSYNKNLYQPKEEGYSGLYYHDNNLASGSLEALIHHLVPTVDYYPDRTYIFTFLLSSRLFIRPHELMSKVCQLCMEQQRLSDLPADKLLTEWTETFPYDFRDERMMRSLKELTHRLAAGDESRIDVLNIWSESCAYRTPNIPGPRFPVDVVGQVALGRNRAAVCHLGIAARVDGVGNRVFLAPRPAALLPPLIRNANPLLGNVYRKAVGQISQGLIRRLTVLGQYEEALVKINAAAAERLAALKAKPQASVQRDALAICNDPFTVAQQLTHIELERLSYIGPEEFVQAFVQKDPLDNEKSCFSDHKKASNLEAYPVKKKQRARVVDFFIDVARECFNIGNFNSLMAIICEFSSIMSCHQMDPSSNFFNYRTALKGATQRSLTANSSREKIVIPFFSLLIKDIYFLNEGCANRLQSGHVNFEILSAEQSLTRGSDDRPDAVVWSNVPRVEGK
ncbi:Ras-GEF domain-containing family member 1B-A [Liparis tanakae]|uniref:Ras-GEF domain-containing family member 1B-A n=1 Tax=Liparis tanakae TaxID=230148 RepID=A0A4Z2G1H1_9TELE|nr:Ras-GEF domain-containing family member 1B-A [Liparis tanakae]